MQWQHSQHLLAARMLQSAHCGLAQVMPLLPKATAQLGYEISAVTLLQHSTTLVCVADANCCWSSFFSLFVPSCLLLRFSAEVDVVLSRQQRTAHQSSSTRRRRFPVVQLYHSSACMHGCASFNKEQYQHNCSRAVAVVTIKEVQLTASQPGKSQLLVRAGDQQYQAPWSAWLLPWQWLPWPSWQPFTVRLQAPQCIHLPDPSHAY